MTDHHQPGSEPRTVEDLLKGWTDLNFRLQQLEASKAALESENKTLRYLIDSIIAHRQKSHTELVVLLTNLVSKLPINEVGLILSKLMEHNANVSHYLGHLSKGTPDAPVPEPQALRTLDHAKKDLLAAMEPEITELLKLKAPIDPNLLKNLPVNPESFFAPPAVRARRCFVKGQVPRERVVRELGEPALKYFADMTTDPKLNPRPKPEEIVMAVKPENEAAVDQDPQLTPEQKTHLKDLFSRLHLSKSPGPEARAQRLAFQRLSYFVELLHYYEHQNTEPADVLFAQRLPALLEQLALGGEELVDESSVKQSEELLNFIVNPDHRQMVINNLGKGGGAAKTLTYILSFRVEKLENPDATAVNFIKHLIPAGSSKAPPAPQIISLLKLIPPAMQKIVLRSLSTSDRLPKHDSAELVDTVSRELGISLGEGKVQEVLPPEIDRQMAWARIKDMVAQRTEPATLSQAIRERLNAHYDAEEIRQSWVVLTEADPMSFIRVFCQLPYLASGKTDPIAKPVMETYLTRLVHEKYAPTYHKLLISLRNMFKAKPDSPTLQTFVTLAKWASPEIGGKIAADVGMAG